MSSISIIAGLVEILGHRKTGTELREQAQGSGFTAASSARTVEVLEIAAVPNEWTLREGSQPSRFDSAGSTGQRAGSGRLGTRRGLLPTEPDALRSGGLE